MVEDFELLLCLKRMLTEDLLPSLTDARLQRLSGGMVLGLDELMHRDVARRSETEPRHKKLRELLARSQACVGLETQVPASTIETVLGAIAELVPILSDKVHGAGSDSASRELARELILEAIDLEADEFARPASQPAESIPEAEAEGPAIDRLRRMDSYFSERLGVQVQVTDVRFLSGGFSRETLMVALNCKGEGRQVVIRKARPFGLLDGRSRTLPEEYPLIRLAWQLGIPTAEPLWLEEDPAVLGQPFIVSAFVAGENLGDTQGADRKIPEAQMRAIARITAQLHCLPWREAKDIEKIVGEKEITESSALKADLDRIWSYWTNSGLTPSPTIAALHDWLIRNMPSRILPLAVSHSDIGFHNILWSGDEVVALLDWELTEIASPARDLAALEAMVSAHVDWERFLDWYVEYGGQRPSPEEYLYQQVLRSISAATCTTISTLRMFRQSRPRDIEYLVMGLPGMSFSFRQAAQILRQVLRTA